MQEYHRILPREVSADAAPYRLGGDEFALLLPWRSLAEVTTALEHLCQNARAVTWSNFASASWTRTRP